MKEIIIPGKMRKCGDCGQENGLFVEVNSMREAFMSGSFCPHSGISIGRHKIARKEAIRFIEEEKAEATPEFIRQARQALSLLMGIKCQRRTA